MTEWDLGRLSLDRFVSLRLQQHGLAWRFRGIPYYNANNEEIGVVDESRWALPELSSEEMRGLGEAIFYVQSQGTSGLELSLYRAVLDWFGLHCPCYQSNKDGVCAICDTMTVLIR